MQFLQTLICLKICYYINGLLGVGPQMGFVLLQHGQELFIASAVMEQIWEQRVVYTRDVTVPLLQLPLQQRALGSKIQELVDVALFMEILYVAVYKTVIVFQVQPVVPQVAGSIVYLEVAFVALFQELQHVHHLIFIQLLVQLIPLKFFEFRICILIL